MNIASSADSKNAFLFLIDIFFEFILYFKFLSIFIYCTYYFCGITGYNNSGRNTFGHNRTCGY